MANILGTQTVNNTLILSVDVNPSSGAGVPAPIGSIALSVDGSGSFYKKTALDTGWVPSAQMQQIGVSVDGLGSAIQVGSLGYSIPNFLGTITSWSIIGDVVGDVVIDIKIGGVSIVGAGNKPTIVAGTSNSANTIGWTTTSFAANTPIEYEIISVSSFKRLNLVLNS